MSNESDRALDIALNRAIEAAGRIPTIHLSSGESFVPGRMIVCNMNGTNEEYGYRLYWEHPNGESCIPVRGLVTFNPFRTEGAARRWAEREFGVRPVRANW